MNLSRLVIALLLPLLGACRSGAIKDDFCHADAVTIATCISFFESKTGSIPTTSQGLAILMERPANLDPDSRWEQIMTKLPTDSWGNSFRYIPDCDARPQKFLIISSGSDGVASSELADGGFDLRPPFLMNLSARACVPMGFL